MQLEFYKQGESKGLYDELFTKYNELLEEVQELRQRAPAQQARRKKVVEVTKKEEHDLEGISSGISGLHLEDVESDILDNFDSDYDYELRVNDLG